MLENETARQKNGLPASVALSQEEYDSEYDSWERRKT